MLFKGESRKEKLEYFWNYYKWPFLGIIAVFIAIIYFAYAAVTEKEVGFSAILFDCHASVNQSVIEEEFAEYTEMDDRQYDISIQTTLLLSDSNSGSYTMTSLAKFYTEIGTEGLDVCMMLEDNFQTYAKADCFLDLRTCMSEQQLALYANKLYEQDGIPVGIYADDLENAKAFGCYTGEDRGIFGITYNSQHVKQSVKFLEYLNHANEDL